MRDTTRPRCLMLLSRRRKISLSLSPVPPLVFLVAVCAPFVVLMAASAPYVVSAAAAAAPATEVMRDETLGAVMGAVPAATAGGSAAAACTAGA